jgi:hypothetical protein
MLEESINIFKEFMETTRLKIKGTAKIFIWQWN